VADTLGEERVSNKYAYLDQYDDYFDSLSDRYARVSAKLVGIAENRKNDGAYQQAYQDAIKRRSEGDWKKNQAVSQRQRGLTHRAEKNGKYTGATIATNIDTGEVQRFEGRRAIEAAGYPSSSVSEAIKKNRPYRGCMWTKEA
jgi:hypothetical protein